MVEIRRATPADIPLIVDLTIEAQTKAYPLTPSRSKIEALTRIIVGSDEHYSMVIDVDGRPVGGVGIYVYEATFMEGKQAAMVHNSCPKAYTGWGVKVMRDAVRWCKDRQDISIIAWSLDPNSDPRYGKLLQRIGLDLSYSTYISVR